ncbi:MAG: phosphoribosylglycinamide formyltransferase [Duncaniella sp.]|nr:phosphoribosylglycinamide formyltransferase [Duncaniella sp.]
MKTKPHVKNIAILASGNGSNAENIIRSLSTTDSTGVRVAVVISNRSDAPVLDKAHRLGVPCEITTKADFNTPETMKKLLDRYSVDGIVLAGFLLMVPAYLTKRYEGRIINIHPSLLPKYGGKGMYGIHIHRAVVANHESETGITIHAVNEFCDDGDIIFQASVPVLPSDTPEDVETKIHNLEKLHFPRITAEYFSQSQEPLA